MTKKDYIIIANVLGTLRGWSAHCFDNENDFDMILDEFAKEFAKENKRFDRFKFKRFALNSADYALGFINNK